MPSVPDADILTLDDIKEAGGYLGGRKTVSYTHLGQKAQFEHHVVVQLQQREEHLLRAVPVSYTHLDVYKRQYVVSAL